MYHPALAVVGTHAAAVIADFWVHSSGAVLVIYRIGFVRFVWAFRVAVM